MGEVDVIVLIALDKVLECKLVFPTNKCDVTIFGCFSYPLRLQLLRVRLCYFLRCFYPTAVMCKCDFISLMPKSQ